MESIAMESPNTPDFTAGFPVNHLRDGAMIQGRVGVEEVVLARRRDEFFVVGATCAHYHGPLAKGIGGGEELRCPYTTPALVFGRRSGIAISYTLRSDRASEGGAEVVRQVLERSDGGNHFEKHGAQEGGSPLKADVDRGTRTLS
jgi:nitrite reductase/ring-hydroxylating ferredoxin subunit